MAGDTREAGTREAGTRGAGGLHARGAETAAMQVLESLAHGVLALDKEGHVLLANGAACTLLDLSADRILGLSLISFVEVQHRPAVKRAMKRAIAGYPGGTLECCLDTAPSNRPWVELDLMPTPDGCVVCVRDLQRRRALRNEVAQQHEELQETLAGLLDNIPVGIVIADGAGEPRLVNRAARELLGIHALAPIRRWCECGILRRPDGSFATADDVPATATLQDGLPRRDIELHVQKPCGDLVPVLLNTDAIHDSHDRVVELCCTFTNIRERRHIEKQLQQAQKMEAVGTLAGGIAHDFNNILCAITGYSELALLKVKPEEESRPLLEEIHKAGVRAAALTRQLLAFSRMDTVAPEVLDLNAAVEEMQAMLRRLIGETIDLIWEPGEDVGRIQADPGQIEQIALNLVINAGDAMSDGGRLLIRTENVTFPNQRGRHLLDLPPGRYAVITVSDSGHGMDEETRSRVFEPFFTTKEQGKGTGLGLSTVYGIVKQCCGHIDIESESGLGTTFRVFLPCVDAAVASSTQTHTTLSRSVNDTETILLVEDEEMVRSLIREILEQANYAVLEASNGREALALLERTANPVDLLLTDVVMPEMGGRELARRLKRRRSELRVLFVSGYADEALSENGLLESTTAFLPKPFDAVTLTNHVRALLDCSTN